MKILYGTTNKGKIDAIRKIIKSHGFDAEIFTNKDIGFDKDIVEDGETFEENSEIKARALESFCKANNITDKIIITDDAGLCVDKLDGAPGIYTARYAGENPTQIENITKVLENLKNYPNKEDRTCKFVCVLTAILPTGEKLVARGECKGSIALEHGKLGGITYGPIFIPVGFNKPIGDMDEEEYASVHNHRDIAMSKLFAQFKKMGY